MTPSRLICALLVPALGAGLWAQGPPRGAGKRSGMSHVGRKANLPPGSPLDRWFRMSPQQRERALQKLPPERQRRIRDQLARFGNLPDDEWERLSRRYERFSTLPPEKQDLVRRQLRRLGGMPEERRRELAREFRRLRAMPEAGRGARFESEEFRTLYSSEEREILRDLAENLAPAPETPDPQ